MDYYEEHAAEEQYDHATIGILRMYEIRDMLEHLEELGWLTLKNVNIEEDNVITVQLDLMTVGDGIERRVELEDMIRSLEQLHWKMEKCKQIQDEEKIVVQIDLSWWWLKQHNVFL